MFMTGQRVRIIGGSQRAGDLFKVTDVMLKSVCVMALDGVLFVKRKQRVVIESLFHIVNRETNAQEKRRRVIYSKR